MAHIVLVILTAFARCEQPNLTGEWAATVAAPRGALSYTMYLTQEGPRLTGYFQSEFGEIPLKGTLNGDEVRLSWTLVDGGKEIPVTMTGSAKNDVISGVAKLGSIGEGTFRAERTGS
jgi:hypothetical protein